MITMMLGLSGLLALTGSLLIGMVVIGAFRDSMKQGMMSLLIPGYALYYGWRKMHKPWLPAVAFVALFGAGVVGFFSSSFEPVLVEVERASSIDGRRAGVIVGVGGLRPRLDRVGGNRWDEFSVG